MSDSNTPKQSTPTLAEVLKLAKRLSNEDQDHLIELLKLRPPKTIEQLAEEKGIKPSSWEELEKAAEGIWPEEDSIDDFLAFLEESRRGAPERRIE